MKKSFSFTVLNFILLFLFTILITISRVIQLKFLTDFNIACNNFKTYEILGLNLNSKMISGFIYSLILIYDVFILFYIFKNKDDEIFQFYNFKKKSNVIINTSLVIFFVMSIFNFFIFLKNFQINKN